MMKLTEKGLSLIEVILAVTILAVGVTGVLLPMMSALGAFHHLDQRNIASQLAKRKIWELEDEARFNRGFKNLSRQETLLLGDRVFDYQVRAKAVPGFQLLSDVNLKLSWAEGSISKTIQREFYVSFRAIEKN